MPRAARTALITGSNKNIGRACALALAKGGFNIVVNGARDRAAAENVAKEVTALGVEALVAMGDVGRREDCARIGAEAIAHFGTIDALLNNAAMRPDGKFLEMSEADFDRVVDTDYKPPTGSPARRFRHGQWLWPHHQFAGMNAIHGYNGRAAFRSPSTRLC